jgi:hypothetical protein
MLHSLDFQAVDTAVAFKDDLGGKTWLNCVIANRLRVKYTVR